jgi:hypothetical protein
MGLKSALATLVGVALVVLHALPQRPPLVTIDASALAGVDDGTAELVDPLNRALVLGFAAQELLDLFLAGHQVN